MFIASKKKRRWRRKRDRIIYAAMIIIAVIIAGCLSFATDMTTDIKFLFIALVILMLGSIVFFSETPIK